MLDDFIMVFDMEHVLHYSSFLLVKHWLPVDSWHERPVMQSFGNFFIVSLNKLSNKH